MFDQGYKNVRALLGGVEGWKRAGFSLEPEA